MTLSPLLLAALLAAPNQDVKVQEAKAQVASAQPAAVVREQLPSYPIQTCLISGEKLGSMGDPIDHVVEGRLIRLCCKGCVKKVDADPKAAIAKVDEAVIRAQKPTYPLTTCPISGEELGDEPVDVVAGTRLIRVCCKNCARKVKADATAALAKVDEAYIQAQLPAYPLKACPVSGEELGSMGEPINMLYGTRLVRVCCKGCVKGVHKDAAAVLAKLDAAAKTAKK